MLSNSGMWFFITEDGSVYRWNNGTLSDSTLIAKLDASFYFDIRKLYNASS